MDEVLNVNNVGISFGSNEVLKSVNFTLYENECLGIIGPNGAGKTVLLNILSGILTPTKGTVTFQGVDISRQKITERCRGGFGRTFQVPRPFEKMTVLENIMLGSVFGAGMSESRAKTNASEIAEFIGLEDKLNWFAGKLGLLERKRLEIGRALSTQPKILLLDEVGGGLTESEVGSIIDLVKRVKANGLSIIWIEHIIRTMLEGTDRTLLIANGVDVICGSPHDVMASAEVREVYMGSEEH